LAPNDLASSQILDLRKKYLGGIITKEIFLSSKFSSIIFIDKRIEHGKLSTLKEYEIGFPNAF